MTATLDDVTKKIEPEPTAEQQAAEELVRRAREQGLSLTGPQGLLKQLTKTVLETALNQELTEHLGHEKRGQPAAESGNIRDGARPKTVLTESTGQVQLDVTRKKDKPEQSAEQKLAEMVARAREQWASVTGPDGLLKQLTKTVLETALNQQMSEHMDRDKHGCLGTRPVTVLFVLVVPRCQGLDGRRTTRRPAAVRVGRGRPCRSADPRSATAWLCRAVPSGRRACRRGGVRVMPCGHLHQLDVAASAVDEGADGGLVGPAVMRPPSHPPIRVPCRSRGTSIPT
jgi:hypothetical protein